MEMVSTAIEAVKLITPTVHGDDRGWFFESFRASWFEGIDFVQDNHSKSARNTLRGLHYQLTQPQGKLVRATRGEIIDVAVDLRRGSDTFGQHVKATLSEENKQMFWVPPGFAHGFLVTSETAEVEYKCSGYYLPSDEHVLRWDDETLDIDWGIKTPILSQRDSKGRSFVDAEYYT